MVLKIEKYKFLGNGRYQVIISGDKYVIYEDIILKYNILSKGCISKNELDLYLKDNLYYEAYYKAIKYIEVKLRTEKEIDSYLKRYRYDDGIISFVINRLKEYGYINECVYTEAYINDQINLKNVGPLVIIRDLEKLGISRDVIYKYIDNYSRDNQISKIKKLVYRDIRLNSNKSSYVLKNKIFCNLINKGFYKEDIEYVLSDVIFDDSSIRDREYERIKSRLSKKYSGSELEYRVKQKMYQKGFKV